jgi:hypothetical protein
MHRVGGLEKEDGTGNISYDPRTTSAWCTCGQPRSRASPPTSRRSRSTATRRRRPRARLGLDVGAIAAASIQRVQARGRQGRPAHLVHLNPFPPNLGDILGGTAGPRARAEHGPAHRLIRAEFLVDARSVNKVQGMPFTVPRDRSRHRRGLASIANSRQLDDVMSTAQVAVTTRRTGPATRRSAGAPAAATTRILPPSRR